MAQKWSKMSDVPNPIFDTNGDPYSGAVLKAYEPGTTTSASIAIDSTGASTQTSITANSDGIWEVSSNEITPYIDRKHKWGIFANATDAAANTPFYMGPFDNIEIETAQADGEIIFEKVSDMVASTILAVGDHVKTLGYLAIGDGGGNEYDVVAAATGTDDGGSFIDLATHQAQGLFPGDHVNVKQFGVNTANSGDQSTAMANAYAYCDTDSSGPGTLHLVAGNIRLTSGLTWGGRVRIAGPVKAGCTFVPVGTFTCITTKRGATEISGFNIDGTNLTGVGIDVNSVNGGSTSDSIMFSDIQVASCSSHGMHIKSGDKGSLENININSNGGDGIRVEGGTGGNAATSCNSWTMKGGISINGNTGIGLNFITGSSKNDNWVGNATIEGQTGGGVKIATINHSFQFYLEANGTPDLELTSTSQYCNIQVLATDSVADIQNDESGNTHAIWSPLQGFWSIPLIGVVQESDSSANGRNLDIVAGAVNASASAKTAGTLSLLGGAASGTNCNGGNVFLKGREGSGTGNQGFIDLSGPINIAAGGTSTTTWDPGSIGDGNEEAKEITVTDAALGDFVLASFSLDLQDLTLSASVTAADTVTAILSNNTGGAIDLGSGTLRVKHISKNA